MSWTPVENYENLPIAIIGGGVLGRRLAIMWASAGKDVNICDLIPEVREQARVYFDENAFVQPGTTKHGSLKLFDNIKEAVEDVWLVVECIPERLPMKIELFGTLDELTHPNVILATNSSSFKSSEMILKVKNRSRVLNTHAFMPPVHVGLELMTSGTTSEAVIDFIADQSRLHGFKPFKVLKESSGFMYNRVWAAIKRESLLVVSEGVTTPEDLDAIFRLRLGSELGPFAMMDNVGLDTVLDIEEHYAAEREGIPEAPRTLLKEYIAKGWLGKKSGRGFYEYK